MRPLLWFLLAVVLAVAIVLPAIYGTYGSSVPTFRNYEEVHRALQRVVDDERKRAVQGVQDALPEEFRVEEFDRLSKGYLAAILAPLGCPDFLAEPKEPEADFVRRMLGWVFFNNEGDWGTGYCELSLAEFIALRLNITDPVRKGIAVYRLRSALKKEELLRLRVSTYSYGEGLVGATAASRALLKREFSQLNLAEAAELFIAEEDAALLRDCGNPILLRQSRDRLLDYLAAARLVSADEARRAKGLPLVCEGQR